VVIVFARVHSGEAPASNVIQGLIEFLTIANHPIAKILRDNVVFKILPMINPDGVFLGNNRCNSVGHDLNRYWNKISSFTHPTLKCTMDLLKEYNSSDVSRRE
jgi:cytosolic carboxypeptidase protein 6